MFWCGCGKETQPKVEDFKDSGLSDDQVNAIKNDWEKSDVHRRIVMASLVQGVYVKHSDEKKNSKESEALAPRWWTSFNFTLIEELREESRGGSIYGAIYQHNNSPKYVVAFRGTDIKPGIACCQDLRLDLHIFCNNLKGKTRVKQARDCVIELINRQPQPQDGAKIWLAGHSLGAAIALIVGKKLMTKGQRNLETYLFNPPIIPSLINCGASCWTVCLCFLNLGAAVCDFLLCRRNPFDAIREWKPHLYVHLDDPVSRGYIDYFKNRKSLGKIDETASRVWWGPRLTCCDVEPMHLLASAELTISRKHFTTVIEAHGIQQWWNIGQDHYETEKY